MEVLHRRADGSFVIRWNGHPYHVTQQDPLFAEATEAARGQVLVPEPVEPTPPPPPPPPEPTLAELQARLAELQQQLARLTQAPR